MSQKQSPKPESAKKGGKAEQTNAQARAPTRLQTGPPPKSLPAKPAAGSAGQAPTGGVLRGTTATKPQTAQSPAKPVQARAGQAPTGTAVAGKGIAAPSVQAPVAAQAVAGEGSGAVANQSPKATPAGRTTAGKAGQAPTAARAGQVAGTSSSQPPTAGSSGQAAAAAQQGAAARGHVSQGVTPSASMVDQGPAGVGAGAARDNQSSGRVRPARGGMIAPPGRGGPASAPGKTGKVGQPDTGGPPAVGKMKPPQGKGGTVGDPDEDELVGPPGMWGQPGSEALVSKGGMVGARKGRVVGSAARGGPVGSSGMAGSAGAGEPGPDSAPELPTMAVKMAATYNHRTVYHWSNPFLFRATETILAVLIVAALILADLPLKSSVWIHLCYASPTVPIAALFGVAALYHRNPLDPVFTLILLGFCLLCFFGSLNQVLLRWREISRNRAHRPAIWVFIVVLNVIIILTLIVDIIWYACFLHGCPCFKVMAKKFAGKKGDAEKPKGDKKNVFNTDQKNLKDTSSVYGSTTTLK